MPQLLLRGIDPLFYRIGFLPECASWRLSPAYLFTSLPYRLTSSRLRLRPPPGLAYFPHFSSPWILQASSFYLLIARIKSLIHTSKRYISASFSKVVPVLNGRKCADLVNLSTMTQTESCPFKERGKPETKSIVMRPQALYNLLEFGDVLLQY